MLGFHPCLLKEIDLRDTLVDEQDLKLHRSMLLEEERAEMDAIVRDQEWEDVRGNKAAGNRRKVFGMVEIGNEDFYEDRPRGVPCKPSTFLPYKHFKKIYITHNALGGALRGHKGAVG